MTAEIKTIAVKFTDGEYREFRVMAETEDEALEAVTNVLNVTDPQGLDRIEKMEEANVGAYSYFQSIN
jgi:hypothetical protein